MNDDPRSAIARLLDHLQPRSLLLLCPEPGDEWRQWCARHCGAAITLLEGDAPLPALERLGHFDAALVLGLIERLDKAGGEQLLGRLRNVHTEHLYALTGDDPRWPFTEWLAYALQRADSFDTEDERLTLYAYDLASYNHVRSWNNPRYWANPENWGKYWW